MRPYVGSVLDFGQVSKAYFWAAMPAQKTVAAVLAQRPHSVVPEAPSRKAAVTAAARAMTTAASIRTKLPASLKACVDAAKSSWFIKDVTKR